MSKNYYQGTGTSKYKKPVAFFPDYINRFPNTYNTVFHISFVDRKNKLHIVFMREEHNNWTFVNRDHIPEWILSLESRFQALIWKELSAEHASDFLRAV